MVENPESFDKTNLTDPDIALKENDSDPSKYFSKDLDVNDAIDNAQGPSDVVDEKFKSESGIVEESDSNLTPAETVKVN